MCQPAKRLEDAEMMRRIDARRFPTIRGQTTEVKENNGRYRIRGDLTFHGVTRPVEGEVTISAPDERSLVIEGEQTFDIRDFGVDPPKILMLKVHPDVRVRVKVVAQQET
jgi:polyisoprenoid-binding protein YceI